MIIKFEYYWNVLEYMKKPIKYQISEKIISSAEARTHEMRQSLKKYMIWKGVRQENCFLISTRF